MFKDKYNNSLNSISPDGYIKQKVLSRISNTESSKQKSSKLLITAIAVAASLAVAISGLAVGIIIKNPFEDQVVSSEIVETEIEEELIASTENNSNEDLQSSQTDISSSNIDNTSSKDDSSDEFSKVPKEYSKIFKAIREISPKYVIDISGSFTSTTNFAGPDKAESVESSSPTSSPSFSNTNIQVKGVDEADYVKTDGNYIYSIGLRYLSFRNYLPFLHVVKAGKTPELVAKVQLNFGGNDFNPNKEMFLCKNKLVIFGYSNNRTIVKVFDVSNPAKPKELYSFEQSGNYKTARMIGDKLYLISDMYISNSRIEPDKPYTFVPVIKTKNYNGSVKANDILIQNYCPSAKYSVICSYDISKGTLIDNISVFGGTSTVYCNTTNIIIAGKCKDGYTSLNCFKIGDGRITTKANGKLKGSLLNQFSVDEYGGYFRFVTTDNFNGNSTNYLLVLDSKLKEVSSIENIALGEQVKSVKFMGDIAYFVTFRQVDPLFSVDLSNPKAPKIIGTLKIPGFSNYMFPYGNDKLLGVGQEVDENTGRTLGIKLSMFDVTNPSNVKEIAKYVIEGNDSEITNNHKALFYDVNRNLIGLPHKNSNNYYLLKFENNNFVLKGEYICLKTYNDYARGLYIGDTFYVAAERTFTSIDLNTFNRLEYFEYDKK